MNFFEQIVYSLQSMTIPTQEVFGLYHLICLALTIGLTIFFCIKFKNSSEKTHKRFLLILWIIILVFEIFKQVVYSFNYNAGAPYWDYQWYAFPYQLCSTPLYILPLAIFSKNQLIKDSACSFLAFFALFGGLCVMIYPGDVFATNILGIALQTMVHHAIMIISGIYLIVRNRDKLNIKYFLKGLVVFAILLAVAILLNEIMYTLITESFNMFYISSHYACSLPLLNMLYPIMPFFAFLLMYIFGFALAGFLIYGTSKLILYLKNKKGQKNV